MSTRNTIVNLLALSALAAGPALAQTAKDELNYSASICIPPTANQFHGSDREGMEWDSRGMWVNRDADESQKLICAVPFDHRATAGDGGLGVVEVRVNVYDNSHLHEVEAKLYATSGSGDPFAARNPLTTAFTSNAFTGADTLLLSATPPNNTRYLWVEITLPREIWPAKRSAVIGLRLNRLGF